MAVRFVVGRSGSGKSLHCFRAIVQMMRADPMGSPVYWVVPKQETFSAERELTCGSGLGGFCRTRIVSFELLGEEILRECGGTAVTQVTELGRQMVLGRLLRLHSEKLAYYRSAARQVGLAAELDKTFAEMERFGRSGEHLDQVINEIGSAQTGADVTPLLNKLRDLRLLYAQYTLYLGQDRLDPHRRLEQMLAALDGCRRVQDSTIFVDGFLEFSDFERRMLAGLAKVARQVNITLLLDPRSPLLVDANRMPDDMGLFYRTEDAYRRLWFAFGEAEVPVETPVILDQVTRFTNPAMQRIEREFFALRATAPEPPDRIELIEAPDRRAEVDAAARHVRALVEQGLRYRDVAVLMRNLEHYHELIDAGFREHDIPYFVDRRRTAAHHPLIQFTRAALQIALHGWPHEAVMTLLKTGLAGVSLDEADELENYVLDHRIRGPAWADEKTWSYRRNLTRAESDDSMAAMHTDATRIDALRRPLVQKLRPLIELLTGTSPSPGTPGEGRGGGSVSKTAERFENTPTPALPRRTGGRGIEGAAWGGRSPAVRDVVVELFNTFERFEVRGTLRQWIKAADEAMQIEQRDEHTQVWTALAELLDQMVDVIGDEHLSADDFVEVLDTGLERFDLALTPPTVDQVLVGAVDRTRSLRPRAVVLLGMNDNQFPRVPREGSILSDNERQTLRRHRLDLDPDCERSLLDERLLGYIAFTRASESICLTRSIADDENRPQSPSPFWLRLREMFPTLEPQQIPRDVRSRIDLIGTPRQLVTALMQWVRTHAGPGAEGAAAGDDPDRTTANPFPSLYSWFSQHDTTNDSIDTMRYRSWRALSYTNGASLAPDIARQLFDLPLRASVSRIESFAACPFKHFVGHGLKLTEREDPDVTPLDLGNVCHGILERLVKQILKGSGRWDAIPPQQLKPTISALASEVGQALRGELMMCGARNQYLLGRIERTIEQVMASQVAAGTRGRFTPWRAELTFGMEGDQSGLPPLVIRTPQGHEVHLRGKIDRVDRVQDQAAVAVVDYKLSGQLLSLDAVYHGLSLQLLTYLLVIQRNGKQLAGKPLTPVAAFYVQILRQLERIKHPDDATDPDDPVFHLKCKPRGIIDVEHRQLFDTAHTGKASEVVQITLKGDESLGYKGRSDGCESVEFAAMLRLVERRLGELADQIVAGRIDVHPYLKGTTSACATCAYRCVCRFEVPPNSYKPMPALKREEVLRRAAEE